MSAGTEAAAPRADVERLLFATLMDMGVVKKSWGERANPVSDLHDECGRLASDAPTLAELQAHLAANRVIGRSVGSALSLLAATAGTKLENISGELQPLAMYGLRIGRWLPTFLVINGPVGRFLTHVDSPLCGFLRRRWADFPVLAAARDVFNHDLFRRVRNAFAHWSFWLDTAGNIRLVNWETGEEDGSLTWLQVEALHFVAGHVVQALDQEILRREARAGADGKFGAPEYRNAHTRHPGNVCAPDRGAADKTINDS